MKKTILILSGASVLLVGAATALALYTFKRYELEANRKKTEKAREVRLNNLRGIPNIEGEFDELNEIATNEKSE